MSLRPWLPVAVVLFSNGVARAQARPLPEEPPPPTAAQDPSPSPGAAAAPAPTGPRSVADGQPPRSLSVGTEGAFQPGVLLQAWFVADHGDGTTSTFRIRRAELHVKGEIVPGAIGYAAMVDPAKVLEFQEATVSASDQDPPPGEPRSPEGVKVRQPVSAVSMFQDFFITYVTPYADVSIGQLKIPVSWEGANSSSKLLFAERALVSREFGDRRDIGLRVAKTFRHVAYSAGLFNGETLNNLDTDNAKDGALRLEAYPVQGLVLAGVAYGSIGRRGEPGTKDRYEADLRFERGPFLLQGEYIGARDVGTGGAAVHGRGFYAAVAWTLLDVLQPAVRVGYLDPDVKRDLDPATAQGSDEVRHLDVGLNYFFRKHEAKLQLVYSRFQFDQRTASDEVILAAQVAF